MNQAKAIVVKSAIQVLLGVKADGDIGAKTIQAFQDLVACQPDTLWPLMPAAQDGILAPLSKPEGGAVLHTYAGRVIRKSANGLYFTAGMTIDADGSPRCYHPDSKKGLDALANAGYPGNWWGIATDGNGQPYIQGKNAPVYDESTRGFYVSTTALADEPNLPANNPRRYVNSEELPFLVLPSDFPHKVRLGTQARVWYQGKFSGAILADIGPKGHLGEGSIALAEALGINANPRTGGVGDGVTYEILV